MRGFAISLTTLARVESLGFFLPLLCDMPQSWHRDGSDAVPFRTVAKYVAAPFEACLAQQGSDSLCAEQHSFLRARSTTLQSTVISDSEIQESRLEDYSICTVHTDV
jgi:hypothetical protein